MNCPHCGNEHNQEKDGRFCDSCGMSVLQYVKRDDESTEEDERVICSFCGVPGLPPRCPACGTRISYPDGR